MMKEILRKGLRLLFLAVLAVSVAMMIRQQLLYRSILSDSEEAARIAALSGREESAPTVLPAPGEAPNGTSEPAAPPKELPESMPEEAAALAGLDLAALRAINEDVVGWIEIPGIGLSYPLLQGSDNQYYLSHSWKREASDGGAVFLEAKSSRELTDFHTIVYAHRMRNDTMFGVLRHYKELDFWQEHPWVYLATDAGVYRYEIFAAQEASVKGLVYRLDLEESGLEEDFLQSCIEGSVIDTGVVPEAGDRFLTLSTCTGTGQPKRWVVHAVLREVWATE